MGLLEGFLAGPGQSGYDRKRVERHGTHSLARDKNTFATAWGVEMERTTGGHALIGSADFDFARDYQGGFLFALPLALHLRNREWNGWLPLEKSVGFMKMCGWNDGDRRSSDRL